MIVNTWSVILLFQDMVCLVLAVFLVAFAIRQLGRAREAAHVETVRVVHSMHDTQTGPNGLRGVWLVRDEHRKRLAQKDFGQPWP